MIHVRDVAYVRTAVPDLAAQESFLVDFGMAKVASADSALYMRGAGVQPVVHISELGSPAHRPGIGFVAASLGDLQAVAAATGNQVTDNEEPGGGKVVRLTDPHGYRLDVLYRDPVAPLRVRSPSLSNTGMNRDKFQRKNTKIRLSTAPSTVLRLGHVVVKVPDVNAAVNWYRDMFGLKITDSVYVPDEPDNVMFAFMHCGLGTQFVDHHSIAFIGIPVPGFDHSAFEVIDVDDVAIGSAHLVERGYRHLFGVGRHVGGSMVFDYWRDTGGNKIEHWTDGDYVNDDYESSHLPMGAMAIAAWGPELTPEFFE